MRHYHNHLVGVACMSSAAQELLLHWMLPLAAGACSYCRMPDKFPESCALGDTPEPMYSAYSWLGAPAPNSLRWISVPRVERGQQAFLRHALLPAAQKQSTAPGAARRRWPE